MKPTWSADDIGAASARMVAHARAHPDSLRTHAEADALPAAQRASEDTAHLLAYLQGDAEGLAPDGEPAVARWLEGASEPAYVVVIERRGDTFSASAGDPSETLGHGLAAGDLEGAIAFARERFAAAAAV